MLMDSCTVMIGKTKAKKTPQKYALPSGTSVVNQVFNDNVPS